MEINKLLRWGILTGLFTIPFIPILVAEQSFFPFITGKNFAFRVIVEIVLALWIVLALRDPLARPKKSLIAWAVLALVMIAGVATIFSLNPYRSFWSNYERMGGYLNLLHVGAYFLILISVLRNKIHWFWLANTSLLANLYVLIYAFVQLAGKAQIHQSGSRLDASLGNSAYLAVYALFHVFIAGYLAWTQWSKNRTLSYLYGLISIVNAIVLYYTATRGAILGLIGGVLVVFALAAIFSKGRIRQVSGIVVGLVVALVVGFIAVKDSAFIRQNQVLGRLASISLEDGTTKSRFMIWQMSWEGFKERPILGWGPENYSLVFAKHYNPEMYGNEPWFDRSHNIFFDWLIDAGVLGLIAYLSIFASALWYLWRERARFGLGAYILVGLLSGYFFQNIFVFDNLISYILFFALAAFIHFMSIDKNETKDNLKVKKDYHDKKRENQTISETKDLIKQLLLAAVGVATITSLYYFNYKPYIVSVELIRAINPNASRPEQSLALFEKIFNRKTFGSGEAFEQLLSRTLGHLNNAQLPDETKMGFVRLADQQMIVQRQRFGADARLNLLAGSYLTNIGRLDEGLDLLEEARRQSPRKQHILFELGVNHVRRQDANQAMAVVKQAYDLAPEYSEARKMYAMLLFLTNQPELARTILAPIKNDPTYFLDERFVSIYRQAGDQAGLDEITKLREKFSSE